MGKFEDILNNISQEEKHPNDRVLLIDGLNIFLRAFAVNGSLNEKEEERLSPIINLIVFLNVLLNLMLLIH